MDKHEVDKQAAWSIYRKFKIFVIIFVTVIGCGFGIFAGVMYGRSAFWMVVNIVLGAVLGITGGVVASKLYLKWLERIFEGESKPFISWLQATLVAVICGVLCTTFIHAILTTILVIVSDVPLTKLWDGFWLLFIGIAEMIGAGAGLVAGALCTSLYMWKVVDKNETAVENPIANEEL